MREFKRDRGYITIAQRSGRTNYLRMAYALALSLKATQSEVSNLSVLVTPGTKIPAKYAKVFDEIIEIPWGDDSERFSWKIHNKWKAYHTTPYKETVLLDADMIFPIDISDWWDTLGDKPAWLTTTPMTYRGTPIVQGAYRKEFILNKLPTVYTAFAYFDQCKEAEELFDMARDVYHTWYALRSHYAMRHTSDDDLTDMMNRNGDGASSWLRWGWTHFFKVHPSSISGDLAFSIALKIMGAEDLYTSSRTMPTFVHMKSEDQNIRTINPGWRKILPCTMDDDLKIMVGNYRQQYPFHYVEKEWLTPDILDKLERASRG